MGPLLYLTVCSWRNRIRRRLKRLKEPRYLIGTVVGLAYFWFFFWRPRGPRPNVGFLNMSGARLSIELAAAAALFAMVALMWLWPSKKRSALMFYRSDVQFLFPAPFTRQELIRFAVFRSQFAVLIGSLFMTIFFRASRLSNGWMFFVGISLVLAILNLHGTGVSLRRTSLGEHGTAGFARQWLPVAVVAGAAIIVVGTVALDWHTLASLARASDVWKELSRLATTGAAGIVLLPFRAVTRLPLAESPAAFLRAVPWALLILILNYFWVIRSDAQFEEASAEFAEKIARIRQGKISVPKVRSVTATPFKLSLEGRPETAILWKNLIMVGRYLSLRTLIIFVPLFVMLGIMLATGNRGGMGAALSVMSVFVYLFTILLGPQIARNDLRRDLANIAVLKTWPISGAALVRGEVMAPAFLLTVIAWLCTLEGGIYAASLKVAPSWVVAAALLAPGLILLQLLAQNAIAVMWPSWFATGAARVRGIDVMGQRLIMMVGLLLVLVVAVIPAGIVAGAVVLGIYFVTGSIGVIAPALAAAVALLAEAFFVSHGVGKLLDRTDVSAIDVTE